MSLWERIEARIALAALHLFDAEGACPDMNPIEKAFSKLKAYLRKIAERTSLSGVQYNLP